MADTTTIVVQVEPAPPDPERIEDISVLFGLFLGWGLPILRSIIRLPSLPLPTTSSPKKTFPCP